MASDDAPEPPARPNWEELRGAFERYSRGRAELLEAIGVTGSNRDPLAEFSERLVAALLDGELAPNRVQPGWDVMASERRVQVKYLANASQEVWVNEHHIHVTADMDDYAIVFFEALLPVTAMVFRCDRLLDIATALRKKHPNQETTLQLTRANYRQLMAERDAFAERGVRIFDLRSGLAAVNRSPRDGA
jgi:hypothetical protein